MPAEEGLNPPRRHYLFPPRGLPLLATVTGPSGGSCFCHSSGDAGLISELPEATLQLGQVTPPGDGDGADDADACEGPPGGLPENQCDHGDHRRSDVGQEPAPAQLAQILPEMLRGDLDEQTCQLPARPCQTQPHSKEHQHDSSDVFVRRRDQPYQQPNDQDDDLALRNLHFFHLLGFWNVRAP